MLDFSTVTQKFQEIVSQIENFKGVQLAAETAVATKELVRITIAKALRDLSIDLEKLRAEIGPIPEEPEKVE